jgi:riboflavin biosynthesis pyrimidine reductase
VTSGAPAGPTAVRFVRRLVSALSPAWSLLEAGMVDELSLMVYPTVVNDGIPLFAGAETRTKLELQHCSELPLGVLHLTYVAAG